MSDKTRWDKILYSLDYRNIPSRYIRSITFITPENLYKFSRKEFSNKETFNQRLSEIKQEIILSIGIEPENRKIKKEVKDFLENTIEKYFPTKTN